MPDQTEQEKSTSSPDAQELSVDQADATIKRKTKQRAFRYPDGTIVLASDLNHLTKFEKDLIAYHCGEELVQLPGKTKKAKPKDVWITDYNPDDVLGGRPLVPGESSPICKMCRLFENGCEHPFMPYSGPKNPLVTILFDSVSKGEDVANKLGTEGSPSVIRKIVNKFCDETGVSIKDVRWVPLTRCANRHQKAVNYKVKGNWCRLHAIDDLQRHPPAMVMPIGSVALGLLSYKSNAQDWTGRLLTYRGWPDDWLTNKKYALPREGAAAAHPIFGLVPSTRLPMVPLQAPRIIFSYQNKSVYDQWEQSAVDAFKLAKSGIQALTYHRDWYVFTDDVETIRQALTYLAEHANQLTSYDTETTGVKPWADDAAIVSIMLRWDSPETGEPQSIGFPWDYDGSAVRPYIPELKRLIWKVLTRSKLVGHNLTFDVLYTYATFWKSELTGWDDPNRNRLRDRKMCCLADAAYHDTWHMAFLRQQKSGSLGLEILTYDFVPDLAGYEEDMSLLIDLHYEEMHPAAKKGGHYLNCSKDKWESHVIPYVMGDVEATHRSHKVLLEKLSNSKTYEFALADPENLGRFRYFCPPSRAWVYENVMAPASRVLMKMMARGMYVDNDALAELSLSMPTRLSELRGKLAETDPKIASWEEEKRRTEKGPNGEEWQLDLENKGHLKDLLFTVLKMPVLRFTKEGRELLGDDVDKARANLRAAAVKTYPQLKSAPNELEAKVDEQMFALAAVDKFTLNKLLAEHKEIAALEPLHKYRKLFKLYSTYVRPLRNIFSAGIDKRERTADAHLCFDGCIHASFLMTGTRGGRLSCKDPNLQQLPRDGEVKRLYVSRFGSRGCIYQGDLSQIELRLLAAACGDPVMVKAYFDETDLHSLTTSRIFGVPYDNFSKDHMKDLQKRGLDKEAKILDEQRSIGKTVNFLTGYGGGYLGLQSVLAMRGIYKKIDECKHIIDAFFETYPSLRNLLQRYKHFISTSGVAVSLFGRVRVLKTEVFGNDEEAKAKALRAGCNHLIQSTASDMMLTALVVIEQMMRDANLESILVSTVHDSLVIDCVRDELPEVHDIVMTVLNNFPDVFKVTFGENFDTSWMIVPFTCDADVGLDYLRMRKIPKDNVDWDDLLQPPEFHKKL